MKKIDPPTIDHRALFDQCVGQTRPTSARQLLEGQGDAIEAAGVAFATSAGAASLHTLKAISLTVEADELVRPMYDLRLVNKSGVGRWAYEKIKTSQTHCPYCTFGEVYEVDHFMPKYDYRELNICPTNLVPICHPCNHIKLTKPPKSEAEYLLHPYFDQPPDVRWLFAELVYLNGGPVLQFRIELSDDYGPIAARLHYHFGTLELDRRFKERSTRVLVEIEDHMTNSFPSLGAAGMKQFFLDESERYFRVHRNCLEAAAYLAAAQNDAFCAGNFKN
jgi:hypothetical protein